MTVGPLHILPGISDDMASLIQSHYEVTECVPVVSYTCPFHHSGSVLVVHDAVGLCRHDVKHLVLVLTDTDVICTAREATGAEQCECKYG